jgi:hypothetical protein
MATQLNDIGNVAHIRFGGRSFDLPLAGLEVTHRSDELQIKNRLAAYLEVSPRQLDAYVVDRHANGNLTLRPEAVFG